MTRFFFLIALVVSSLARCAQADEPSVEFLVRLDRPHTQIITVEVHLSGISTDTVNLLLPTWRPGKYLILDPASEIRQYNAHNDQGQPLKIVKTSKSEWRVTTGGAESITVSYDLYANSIRDRTRHVDDTHAFLSGSSVFMLWPEARDQATTIRFDPMPPGWDIATGLKIVDAHTIVAPNYDILVDSPIEVGIHDRLQFAVDGVPHEIVLWGSSNYDAERLRRDFADIVREQTAIFGSMPYERYVFLLHVQPGLSGGTEHYNSTVMSLRPTAFDSPSSYRSLLGLASHEMFHTWNVKRFRPAGISPYNYLYENYSPSFWLVEGSTSYYDDVTLARVGLIDFDEYLSRITSSINGYEARPGKHVQSLAESSHDAWIKYNRSGPDRDNTTVSFYRKGSLASLILDAEIRRLSNNRNSFDTVMKALYEQFPYGSAGYTPEDVIQIASHAAGEDLGPLFESIITGTDLLPLESALEYFGIEMTRTPVKSAWQKEEKLDGASTRPYLGLKMSGTRVSAVLDDGPASLAGFNADDELLAINGQRVTSSNFKTLESDLEVGETVNITFFRRETLRTQSVVVGSQDNTSLKLRLTKEPTPEQIAAFESWMDLEWPNKGDDDDDESDLGEDAETP